MIHPTDEEYIHAMVGPIVPSPAFVAEYETRLSMLHHSGMSGPLGPALLIPLLREFDYEAKKKPEVKKVENWRGIPIGSEVVYNHRRGTFEGPIGDGSVGVRLEGEMAVREVPAREVAFATEMVDGVPDSEFEKEPDPPAAVHTEPDAPEYLDEEEREERAFVAAWGDVTPGTKFKVHHRYDPDDQGRYRLVDAEFIDIAEEGDDLLFSIDDQPVTIKKEDVVPQEEEVAS